jgi:hypothetical protein
MVWLQFCDVTDRPRAKSAKSRRPFKSTKSRGISLPGEDGDRHTAPLSLRDMSKLRSNQDDASAPTNHNLCAPVAPNSGDVDRLWQGARSQNEKLFIGPIRAGGVREARGPPRPGQSQLSV